MKGKVWVLKDKMPANFNKELKRLCESMAYHCDHGDYYDVDLDELWRFLHNNSEEIDVDDETPVGDLTEADLK